MVNVQNISMLFMLNIVNTVLFCFIYIYYIDKPKYLIYHLIIIIVSQNLIIGLGNLITDNQTNGDNLKLVLVYKEFFAGIIALLLMVKNWTKVNLHNFEKAVPFIGFLMFAHLVISNEGMDAKAYYLRTFLVMFVAYIIGRYIYSSLKIKDFQQYYSFVVNTGVIVAIFGFVFMIIDYNSFVWNEWFNLGIMMEAKRGSFQEYPHWQTQLGDFVFPRMFSFIFDPIVAGYFFATAFIFSFLHEKKNILFKWILGGALLSTLVKGAIGIVLITAVWYFVLHKMRMSRKTFITLLIMGLVGVFVFFSGSSFKSSHDVHFNGFIEPIQNSPFAPVGHGLGAGGNYYASQINVPAWNLTYTGAESFFGVLVFQLGYPGLLLYLIFFIGLIKLLLNQAYMAHETNKKFYVILSGLTFSVFVASLLQESTLGINYTGTIFILLGFVVSMISKDISILKKNQISNV